MTGEWAQQAADKEGATVYDADLDLYSGVGGVAGLFDLATIVILPASGLACQSKRWRAVIRSTCRCLLTADCLWIKVYVLLHGNKASFVSELPIETLQGLQLAPLSVKEAAISASVAFVNACDDRELV